LHAVDAGAKFCLRAALQPGTPAGRFAILPELKAFLAPLLIGRKQASGAASEEVGTQTDDGNQSLGGEFAERFWAIGEIASDEGQVHPAQILLHDVSLIEPVSLLRQVRWPDFQEYVVGPMAGREKAAQGH